MMTGTVALKFCQLMVGEQGRALRCADPSKDSWIINFRKSGGRVHA